MNALTEHPSPLVAASPRKVSALCAAIIAWSGVMFAVPGLQITNASFFVDPMVKSRVLIVELADKGSLIQSAAPTATDVGHLRLNTLMDFVFIILYFSMLLAFADLAKIFAPKISALLAGLALLAGGSDVLENFGILSEMKELSASKTVSDAGAGFTSFFSQVKWSAFSVALIFLAIVLVRLGFRCGNGVRGTVLKLLGTVTAVSGGVLLYGLTTKQFHFIGIALYSLLAPAILVCIPIFFSLASQNIEKPEFDSPTIVPCDPSSVIARTAYAFDQILAQELILIQHSRGLRLREAPIFAKATGVGEKTEFVTVEKTWSAQLISYSRQLARQRKRVTEVAAVQSASASTLRGGAATSGGAYD